jgi:DNA-binding GntR family transcriptional regulator
MGTHGYAWAQTVRIGLRSSGVAREVDHRFRTPPYLRIAAYSEAGIEAGVLAAGRPIPSERELCVGCGVARDTARSAVARLRDAGLVETVSGRGSHVVEGPPTDGGAR